MPFFNNSSNFNIHGGEMNDIAGNQNKNTTIHNNNSKNSNNTSNYTTTNSHNDSSKTTHRMGNVESSNAGTINNYGGKLPQVLENGTSTTHQQASSPPTLQSNTNLAIQSPGPDVEMAELDVSVDPVSQEHAGVR